MCDATTASHESSVRGPSWLPLLVFVSLCVLFSPLVHHTLRYSCDDLTSIKKRLPEFRRVLTDPKDFKQLYRFVFNIAKMNTVKVLGMHACVCWVGGEEEKRGV